MVGDNRFTTHEKLRTRVTEFERRKKIYFRPTVTWMCPFKWAWVTRLGSPVACSQHRDRYRLRLFLKSRHCSAITLANNVQTIALTLSNANCTKINICMTRMHFAGVVCLIVWLSDCAYANSPIDNRLIIISKYWPWRSVFAIYVC